MESGLRRDYGIIIVAIRHHNGEMVFNPQPVERLTTGDTLVVLGKKEDIVRLNGTM